MTSSPTSAEQDTNDPDRQLAFVAVNPARFAACRIGVAASPISTETATTSASRASRIAPADPVLPRDRIAARRASPRTTTVIN